MNDFEDIEQRKQVLISRYLRLVASSADTKIATNNYLKREVLSGSDFGKQVLNKFRQSLLNVHHSTDNSVITTAMSSMMISAISPVLRVENIAPVVEEPVEPVVEELVEPVVEEPVEPVVEEPVDSVSDSSPFSQLDVSSDLAAIVGKKRKLSLHSPQKSPKILKKRSPPNVDHLHSDDENLSSQPKTVLREMCRVRGMTKYSALGREDLAAQLLRHHNKMNANRCVPTGYQSGRDDSTSVSEDDQFSISSIDLFAVNDSIPSVLVSNGAAVINGTHMVDMLPSYENFDALLQEGELLM